MSVGSAVTPAWTVHVLAAPKQGNTEAEYEDAHAAGEHDGRQTLALADGASSSVFAREWARLLADEFALASDFAAAPPIADAAERIAAERIAAERIAALGRRWHERARSGPLRWYTEEKIARGAHAALLVVVLDTASRTFAARAVGDACLFIVRDDILRLAFPITGPADFDNRPNLVGTDGPAPVFARADGTFDASDRFLLMTDALAAWFLAETAAGHAPWRDLPTRDVFPSWLAGLRASGALRNDDVTLVTADLEPARSV